MENTARVVVIDEYGYRNKTDGGDSENKTANMIIVPKKLVKTKNDGTLIIRKRRIAKLLHTFASKIKSILFKHNR